MLVEHGGNPLEGPGSQFVLCLLHDAGLCEREPEEQFVECNTTVLCCLNINPAPKSSACVCIQGNRRTSANAHVKLYR
jgi:hypothetical protein